MKRYGVCDCGRWGEEPKGFDEARHFLQCECGKLMYLTICDPREAAYPERAKISTIRFISQDRS